MGQKCILIILDGWGYSEETEHNAIRQGDTPYIDKLMERANWTLLEASGEHVGLEPGIAGNSEVGHLTLGAGRVIDYESTRVQKAIHNGELQKHPRLQKYFVQVKKRNSCVHLLGLLSSGNVHAHYRHFIPFLQVAKEVGLEEVYLHLFTDGRESPNGSAISLVKEVEQMIKDTGTGMIATIVGRQYGMDRNKRWEKTEQVYKLLTEGEGKKFKGSAEEVIQAAYLSGQSDDTILPSCIVDQHDQPIGIINENDLIISVNFRGDRMRQILQSFMTRNDLITLTDYHLPGTIPLFEQIPIKNGLSDILNQYKIRNLRISETEKYPHVTFFINGKEEKEDPYQTAIHIPSPDVKDYRETPEMRAAEIADSVQEAIKSAQYPLIIVNLVNADILGHSGDLELVKKAVQSVDLALQEIVETAEENHYWTLICGDHGNADMMWESELGVPHVGHTTNPVPFILHHATKKLDLHSGGTLADVAPTLLDLLGIDIPLEMTGKSLVINERLRDDNV